MWLLGGWSWGYGSNSKWSRYALISQITKTPVLSLPEQIQEIFKIKVALLQLFRLLQQGVTLKEVA